MQEPHRPNSVPLRARAFLVVAAAFLLLVAGAELLTGHAYVPLKRGGIFLTGIPILALAGSLLALCAACVLAIVDHYDTRPNEHAYRAGRLACLKAALFLFIAVPVLHVVLTMMQGAGFDVPAFEGLAHRYTLHVPEFRRHLHLVAPLLDHGLAIGLASAALVCAGALVDRFGSEWRRASTVLVAVGVLGVSSLVLAGATRSFLAGEAGAGRRDRHEIVHADTEPAKFNAVLLTRFGTGGILFATGLVMLFFGARPPAQLPGDRNVGP